MEGIVKEGKSALEKDEDGASFDCGLIGAALRTEHYEIAAYQAAISMAKTLGMQDVMDLLTENLNEELAAAAKITEASQPILLQSSEEPEKGKKLKSAKEKYSAQKSREDERQAAAGLRKRAS
jgi:ferritin-like metal-binding protein YciE